MNIIVSVKNVYGRETIYPECAKAKTFARLIRQKTLTVDDVREIKSLGYKIELKQNLSVKGLT